MSGSLGSRLADWECSQFLQVCLPDSASDTGTFEKHFHSGGGHCSAGGALHCMWGRTRTGEFLIALCVLFFELIYSGFLILVSSLVSARESKPELFDGLC